jgi:DNA-binding GntR family transcriptional regulator
VAVSERESMPLREIAYRRLREDILSCRLFPGQRITEREIVAETSLGISAIREALTRLDQEGLVSTQPRRGYQVKPVTVKGVDDVFDFWEILGPEVVRRGVTGATQEQLDQVIAGFDEMLALDSTGPPSRELTQRWFELSEDTFAVLADAAANDYIISTSRALAGELRRVWSLLIDSELMVSVSQRHRAAWREALSHRDGATAAAHTRQWIRQSHDRVLRILARWPSVVTAEIVTPPGLAAGRA